MKSQEVFVLYCVRSNPPKVLGHFVVFWTEQINCSIHNRGTFAGENYFKFAQAKPNASVVATVASQQVQVLSASTQSGDLSTVAANLSKLYLLLGYASYYYIKHSISVVWHTTLLHPN